MLGLAVPCLTHALYQVHIINYFAAKFCTNLCMPLASKYVIFYVCDYVLDIQGGQMTTIYFSHITRYISATTQDRSQDIRTTKYMAQFSTGLL